MRPRHHAHPRDQCHQWGVGRTAWVAYRSRRRAKIGRSVYAGLSHLTRLGGRLLSSVSTRAHRFRTGLRPQGAAQSLGLLASGWPRTLRSLVAISSHPPFLLRCRRCEPLRENVSQWVGGGGRGLGRPAFPPPPATQGPAKLGRVRRRWAARRQARLARLCPRRLPVARPVPPLLGWSGQSPHPETNCGSGSHVGLLRPTSARIRGIVGAGHPGPGVRSTPVSR